MTLDLTTLLAPALLALGLATCLWLLLNAKAESQHRDGALDRRISLLEERMEKVDQNGQGSKPIASSTGPAYSTSNFEIEVALAPQAAALTKLSAATSPSPALLRKAVPTELLPDQLDFLASLNSRGLAQR